MYTRTVCVLHKGSPLLGELAEKNEFINNLPPAHRNFIIWILLSSCDFSPLSGFLDCPDLYVVLSWSLTRRYRTLALAMLPAP